MEAGERVRGNDGVEGARLRESALGLPVFQHETSLPILSALPNAAVRQKEVPRIPHLTRAREPLHPQKRSHQTTQKLPASPPPREVPDPPRPGNEYTPRPK